MGGRVVGEECVREEGGTGSIKMLREKGGEGGGECMCISTTKVNNKCTYRGRHKVGKF